MHESRSCFGVKWRAGYGYGWRRQDKRNSISVRFFTKLCNLINKGQLSIVTAYLLASQFENCGSTKINQNHSLKFVI